MVRFIGIYFFAITLSSLLLSNELQLDAELKKFQHRVISPGIKELLKNQAPYWEDCTIIVDADPEKVYSLPAFNSIDYKDKDYDKLYNLLSSNNENARIWSIEKVDRIDGVEDGAFSAKVLPIEMRSLKKDYCANFYVFHWSRLSEKDFKLPDNFIQLAENSDTSMWFKESENTFFGKHSNQHIYVGQECDFEHLGEYQFWMPFFVDQDEAYGGFKYVLFVNVRPESSRFGRYAILRSQEEHSYSKILPKSASKIVTHKELMEWIENENF